MKQYCRYCSYMSCGDANYCSKKRKCYSDSTIKHTNHCKEFELNEIDALAENTEPYKPREQENKNQIKLF